jgi:Flp pilus assembly protein TadD
VRRLALTVSAGLLLATGGVFAFQSWRHDVERRDEVARRIADARTLIQSDAGYSQAKLELDRALELAPDDAEALVFRGELLLRLSKHDDAIRDLERAVELTEAGPRARANLLLGRAWQERFRGSGDESHFRRARSAFQDARLDPESEAEAMEAYAALFIPKGRFRDVVKAIDVFEELLKKHPDYPGATAIRELVEALKKESG